MGKLDRGMQKIAGETGVVITGGEDQRGMVRTVAGVGIKSIRPPTRGRVATSTVSSWPASITGSRLSSHSAR